MVIDLMIEKNGLEYNMTMTNTLTSDYILNISRDYSIYVCENRAIPKIADGLKDGQRKMLWLMKNRSDKIKTVSLSGTSISEGLYLHGDMSASETISMMAAPYCNNVPFLDGVGNFGTRVNPTGWGAARYTYVKRNKAAQEIMFPDMDIVPTKENYDGSNIEPEHFLPLIPTVLLNGVSGIAVGWSTEILPRSLKSLIDATITVLEGKKLKRITPHYENYDLNISHLEGNSWSITGKAKIIDASTVHVSELPPDLSLEKFKERLNEFEESGKINTYTDKSTDVINITIKMPRGACKDWSPEYPIEFFKLRQKKSERIVVVDWTNKGIKQYESAEKVIEDFVTWRLDWYTKRYEKKVSDTDYELNFWLALKECVNKKLSDFLRKAKNRSEIKKKVIDIVKDLVITDEQIDKIVSLPSYRWAEDYILEIDQNISNLTSELSLYREILADPSVRKSIYLEELKELRNLKF